MMLPQFSGNFNTVIAEIILDLTSLQTLLYIDAIPPQNFLYIAETFFKLAAQLAGNREKQAGCKNSTTELLFTRLA